MTPEEIVKRLRADKLPLFQETLTDAADLIERQAKALEEAEEAMLYVQEWFDADVPVINDAIATIRAVRGEK